MMEPLKAIIFVTGRAQINSNIKRVSDYQLERK